jgi:hypothetical protein
MKKINALWIILDSVFLIIFNAVFFMTGGVHHKASAWISYGFVHFAYLALLATPKLIPSGKSSAVFGFSLYSVSIAYFLTELAVGAAFMLKAPDGYEAALITQLILSGLYVVTLISNMIANEHTADTEAKRNYQIEYVKQASSELKSLLGGLADKETRANVEKAYDALCSSPVKSHPSLAQAEQQILSSLGSLRTAVSAGDKTQIVAIANQLLTAVNERNRQLKIFN